METALSKFFAAWSETDPAARQAKLSETLAEGCIYSDPRSGSRLEGIEAASIYVSAFSKSAPGWTAQLVSLDEVNGYGRAIVSFGGLGPDGNEVVQHGTYFVEADSSGKLTQLAGFAGLGKAD